MSQSRFDEFADRRLSRRTVNKYLGAMIGSTITATALAACGGNGDGNGDGGTEHVVDMNDQLEFDPESITINVGDTIVWRTVGTVPHTATCDEELANNPEEHVQRPEGAEPWDSGNVAQGEEYSREFTVPGEYTYFCIPHEAAGMIGYITVEE